MFKLRCSMLAACLVSSLLISGCYVDPRYANEQSGALTGAVAGGVLGATVGKGAGQGFATIVGAMIGSAVGSDIGRTMDRQAQDRANRAYGQAMQSGQSVQWRSSRFQGQVMPSRHVFYIDGRACRRFSMVIEDGQGGEEIVNGTSCDYGQKGWIVVDEQHTPKSTLRAEQKKAQQNCHCHCHEDQ